MTVLRLTLVVVLLIGISGAPLPAAAQQADHMPQIGWLHPGSPAKSERMPAFIQGLRDFGYVDGRNIRIEYRFAEGRPERLPELAADLVRQKVKVIVCPGGAAGAAMGATSTIPIVVAVASDFVVRGWAKSLSRPGGNVTGLSTLAAGLAGKQLELLKEVVPTLSRVAVLAFNGNRGHADQVRRMKNAAPTFGLEITPILIKSAADLPGAFARMKHDEIEGLIVLRHGLLVHLRETVVALAREAALPSLFGHVVEARAGGLMAYGADTAEMYHRAGAYVDKILKGADPAELPIAQATKFNLTVNLETAKALGVAFPPSILLRADGVVE